MDPKDIMKMEAGPELDLLVARDVMRQTDFNHPGFFWSEGNTEDGEDGWDGFYCPRCSASEGDLNPCVKPYSTHIAYAWEVLEHVTWPPRSAEEADRGANVKFMQLFRAADLWAYSAKDAATMICKMALIACSNEPH
jgi:hypothetical protein